MTEPTRGRILLAAYHFPPSAAVGGLRVTRFARFLPEFGWEPHVLTIRDADRDPGEGEDPSRLAGLEDVPVTRTRAPSGLIRLYTRIKARLKGSRSPQVSWDVTAASARAERGRESLTGRFKRYVTSLVALLPDEQKNWSVLASLTAVRLVRRHRLDWVLTSGPPFSVHFVGFVTRACTGAKWVADFRDPWIEMLPERPPFSRSWLSDRIEAWMERLVMRHADRVLTTTERMRASFLQRHPGLPAEKFECLPNGIDSQQVPADEHAAGYDRLTITYAGTLYFDRTPEPLFRAVGELLKEGLARPDDLSIKLVGNCARIGGVDTLELAGRYGVEATVEVIPRVPRAEAFRIMQRSHLLLVLAPPNHGLVLPAKIFDYLGSGAQILALAEPGATTDLVEETGCGRAFASTDTGGLKDYIGDLVAGGRYKTLRSAPRSFARYEASHLVGQLAVSLADASVQRSGLVEPT
jgi:glycosyltransferase involved in cell wall biosynthesis